PRSIHEPLKVIGAAVSGAVLVKLWPIPDVLPKPVTVMPNSKSPAEMVIVSFGLLSSMVKKAALAVPAPRRATRAPTTAAPRLVRICIVDLLDLRVPVTVPMTTLRRHILLIARFVPPQDDGRLQPLCCRLNLSGAESVKSSDTLGAGILP